MSFSIRKLDSIPNEAEARVVRALIVEHGTNRVSGVLQVDRETTVRVAAALPVRRASLALVRANLPKLTDSVPSTPSAA